MDDGARRAWRWRRTAVPAAAVAGGGLLPLAAAAVVQADETHRASHNGPQVTMISTGQIDDPFEDVLEHASLLRQHSRGWPGPEPQRQRTVRARVSAVRDHAPPAAMANPTSAPAPATPRRVSL